MKHTNSRISVGNRYMELLLQSCKPLTITQATERELVPLSIGCKKDERWILGQMLKDLLHTDKEYALVTNNENQLEIWQTGSADLELDITDRSSLHFDLNTHKKSTNHS